MKQSPTSLSSWTRALVATMRTLGLDAPHLIQEAGLDPALLRQPQGRYALEGTTRLWALAMQASGREDLGLEVARHVDHATFQALGYALLASTTLQDAFERLLRYFAVVSDAGSLELRSDSRGTTLVIAPVDGPIQPAPQAIEAMVCVIYRMGRRLYGRGFSLQELHFSHPAPSDTQAYRQAFGLMPQFAADQNLIRVCRGVMDESLPTGNPELARANEALLEITLNNIQRPDIVQSLRDHLAQHLANGEPSLQQLAQHLYMSPRKLQRQLAAHDTSFSRVLDELRQELAKGYLANAALSLSEVCFLLGFQDVSSLNRACQRWFQSTPGQLRESVAASQSTSALR